MRSKRNIRLAVSIFMAIAMALILPGISIAGDLEPSGAPAPTMKTLDQIPPTWSQILPASKRFEKLDACIGTCPIPKPIWGVLDKETGLVWEKSPDTLLRNWTTATDYCYNKALGGRKGWRFPTVEELASLVDPSMTNPALPSGHPFINVQSDNYWSATTYPGYTTTAWCVDFSNGYVNPNNNTLTNYAWCVRGGQGADTQ